MKLGGSSGLQAWCLARIRAWRFWPSGMYPISTSKLKLQDTDEEVGQRVTVLIGESGAFGSSASEGR